MAVGTLSKYICVTVFTHLGFNNMETGDGEKTSKSESAPQTQQLCRYFSQGRHCNFGKKCKFLHVRDDGSAQEKDTIKTPSQSDVTPPNSEDPGGNVGQRPPVTNNSRAVPAAGRRPCRYFISGHCTMEDRCRFWHPPQVPSVDDLPVPGNHTRPAQRRPPVQRPSILQEVKLCDLTEDVAKDLRDTEIKQLKKRFPKDQLIIQEQSEVTYYRVTVEATDPDWVNIFFDLFSPLLYSKSYYLYNTLHLSLNFFNVTQIETVLISIRDKN